MQNLLSDLQALLLESALSKDPKDLFAYAHSKYQQFAGNPHAVVVHVRSTSDVVDIVTLCGKHCVPIVVYSGGTSLEGNLSGAEGQWEYLSRSIAHEQNLGYQCGRLGCYLRGWRCLECSQRDPQAEKHSTFLPAGPGSWCNNRWYDSRRMLWNQRGLSSTVHTQRVRESNSFVQVRYGTARGEYILNLTAVLASGQVIKTRQRARKSSAGFDLTKLFIGAEGTLGIVTEATLRLTPTLPTSVAVVSFPDVRKATAAVTDILKLGAVLQCAELVDDIGIKAMNTYGKSTVKWRETDTIFFKYQGSPAVMRDTSDIVQSVISKYDGTGYHYIEDQKDAETLWADRKNGLFGVLQTYPGRKGFITDVCVPVSRLPDIVAGVRQQKSHCSYFGARRRWQFPCLHSV